MTQELSLRNPDDLMKFSNTLKDYISRNNLAVVIQKKQFVMSDGWKFAGLNFGLSPIVESVEKVSLEGQLFTILYESRKVYDKLRDVPYMISEHMNLAEGTALSKDNQIFSRLVCKPLYKYKVRVNIVDINTGNTISSGEAMCSNMESAKLDFDEYAVNSMAQTRAISKAYRNVIGFVMQNAGFESTPAEEMEEQRKKEQNSDAIKLDNITEITSKLNTIKNRKELLEYVKTLSKEMLDNKALQSIFTAKKLELMAKEVESKQKADV